MRERVAGVEVDANGTVRAASAAAKTYGYSLKTGPGRAWTASCDGCSTRWFTYGQDAGLKQLRDHWLGAHG